MSRLAVVGAGPVGRATAAFLAHHGHAVGLLSPSGAGTEAIAARASPPGRGVIEYKGALHGRAEIDIFERPEPIAAAEVVVIALPGYAYPAVLGRILPILHARQSVIVSGALSLVPLRIHENVGSPGDRPTVIGWGTTLATARHCADADVEINTLRERFEVAAIPASQGAAALSLCRALFGERFNLVDSILATTLSNVNPIAHAAEALPNLTRMERGEHWYLFEGMTPAAARICEALDGERLAIAQAYGLSVRTIEEHYRLSYHVDARSVAEIAAAIHTRDRAPPGPKTLQHRYVLEDVPYGLVFYERLAQLAGVRVPVMTAAIELASAAYGRDFRRENGILDELGIDALDPKQLRARCAGGSAFP